VDSEDQGTRNAEYAGYSSGNGKDKSQCGGTSAAPQDDGEEQAKAPAGLSTAHRKNNGAMLRSR
jgi:hypothetical protein